MKDGYYIHHKGKTQGPIGRQRLQQVIGKVPTSASLRKSSSSTWVPVAEFIRAEGLQRFVEQTARIERQERTGPNPTYVVMGGIGLSLLLGLLIVLLWPSSEPAVVASAEPVEQVVAQAPVQPAGLIQPAPAPAELKPAKPTEPAAVEPKPVKPEPTEPEPVEPMVAKPVGLHPPTETPPTQTVTSPAEPDIRNVNWGMSVREVKDLETAEFSRESPEGRMTYMLYKAEVGNDDATLGYVFVDDKLVRVKYVLLADHSNNNVYIYDFTSLNETLVDKYGRATEDNVIGDDEYSLGRGNAIGMGRLMLYTKWETDATIIGHTLSGNNLEIMHVVEYVSRKLGHLEEEAKNKRLMDNL